MATFTNVLLNCQTASYGEIFNVVDYILLAPLEGQGVYFNFDNSGRPTATIYVHLRAGGALGGPPGPAAQQMIYHQCRLVEFAIITRAIRDLPTTDFMSNANANYVSVTPAGAANAGVGGGLTGTYNAVLHKLAQNGHLYESSVGAQSNSIRALEAAHHAMATVVSATDDLAGNRTQGRRDLGQLTGAALQAVTPLARGSVVIDFGGQRVGVQYIITAGNAAATGVPTSVAQVDINRMSEVVAAATRRQVFRSHGVNGEWWGGLPRMFHEFVRTHAAIAPGSNDVNIGSLAARAAAQAALTAANGVPTANTIRTFWALHPAPGAATATLYVSPADPTPLTPSQVWGAAIYANNPNWTLQNVWGTAPALNLIVLRRDNVPGRNPPHLVNPPPQTVPPHANEVLTAVQNRANLQGGTVESDGGLPEYRQDHATRQTTPPWIAAAVAMIRFVLLPQDTLVVGRRSSILEAAYVSGIAVYVIGDGTPAATQRNWNPILTQETEQANVVVLNGDDPVPIGVWRRPRAAPFSYLSTQHRDLAYRILNGAARPGNATAPNLYQQQGQFYLGGNSDQYLIDQLAAGNNAVSIEVTAEIV
jgi:hypothetical protein